MPFTIFALAQIPYQFPQTIILKCTWYLACEYAISYWLLKQTNRRYRGRSTRRSSLKLRDEKRKEASPRTGQFARGILLGTNAYDERHFARANVFRHSVSLVEFTANYLSRALPTRTCNATLFADWVTHSLALASERALIYAVSYAVANWARERERERERETAIAYKCNPFDATRAKSERSADTIWRQLTLYVHAWARVYVRARACAPASKLDSVNASRSFTFYTSRISDGQSSCRSR